VTTATKVVESGVPTNVSSISTAMLKGVESAPSGDVEVWMNNRYGTSHPIEILYFLYWNDSFEVKLMQSQYGYLSFTIKKIHDC
jgi:uncharacterized protein YcfL